MNKNAFKIIVGSLLFAVVIHYIKPTSRHAIPTASEEQETIPVRAEVPEAYSIHTSPEIAPPPATINVEATPTTTATSIPEVIRKVQESLPRNGQLTFKNNKEIHHVHPAVLNAGMQLGHLKEIWMQKPEARKAALDFYEQCTFDHGVIDSVRALCYISAIEVSVYLKKTERVMAWNLDRTVQSLASRLMDN